MTVAIVAFSGAVALAVWKTSAQTARGVAADASGSVPRLSLAAIVRASPGLDDRPSSRPPASPRAEGGRVAATNRHGRWHDARSGHLPHGAARAVSVANFGDERRAPAGTVNRCPPTSTTPRPRPCGRRRSRRCCRSCGTGSATRRAATPWPGRPGRRSTTPGRWWPTCLGAEPGEVVFTAGGTEADNLAVAGVGGLSSGRVVCSAVEHHAVLHSCAALGERAVVAPVTADGVIDLDRLDALLEADVCLVSVMLANNEVGTVQPLAAVAELVRGRAPGAVVHTDAVQAFSWLDVATLARPGRPGGGQRPQVRGAEGRRRPRRAPGRGARTPAARRRPGARPAQRHPQRAGHRRDGGGHGGHGGGAGGSGRSGWPPFGTAWPRAWRQRCPTWS